MTRPTAPTPPPLLPAAEDLARLFHRTYERMGPDHGYGQGVKWDGLDERYRRMLVDVFADMELALRPGRSVTEVHAGQTVVIFANVADLTNEEVEEGRALIASWLPDVQVHMVNGITGALVYQPGITLTPVPALGKEGHG